MSGKARGGCLGEGYYGREGAKTGDLKEGGESSVILVFAVT